MPSGLDWFQEAQWQFYENTATLAYVIDVETTGLDSMRNEILTLSLGCYTYPGLELVDELELKMKPQRMQFWSKEAEEKAHKISREEAMLFEPKPTVWRRFFEFLNRTNPARRPQLLVFHAQKDAHGFFDWVMLFTEIDLLNVRHLLCQHFTDMAIRSTVNYYRQAVNAGLMPPLYEQKEDGKTRVTYKLNRICEAMGIDLNHHEVKSDRLACFGVFKRLKVLQGEMEVHMNREDRAHDEHVSRMKEPWEWKPEPDGECEACKNPEWRSEMKYNVEDLLACRECIEEEKKQLEQEEENAASGE